MAEGIITRRGGGGLKDFFGDGSDGVLNTAANVTLTSVLNGPAIVKQYESITINAGHTLTVSQPNQGLVLYSKGDVTIDGIIDMSEKAGLAPNGNTIPMIMSSFKATDPKGVEMFNQLTTNLLNLKGGTGGIGGYGGGRSGANRVLGGTGGAGRQNLGGLAGGGGGGSGNNFAFSYPNGGGRGGSITNLEIALTWVNVVYPNYNDPVFTGTTKLIGLSATDGAGGYGLAASGGSGDSVKPGKGGGCFGGGGGGGGGAETYDSTFASADNGANGKYSGGFILIITKGNITINGTIKSDGGAGGNGGSNGVAKSRGCGGGGGGGAGAGVISINHKGAYINNGIIQVLGGLGGLGGLNLTYGGEAGGPGTSGSIGTINIQQL